MTETTQSGRHTALYSRVEARRWLDQIRQTHGGEPTSLPRVGRALVIVLPRSFLGGAAYRVTAVAGFNGNGYTIETIA